MRTVLFEAFGIGVTPWKLIGYFGAFMFAGRWFVQIYASRIKGRPTLPSLFWFMSISGNLLLLSYFIFGQNDSVGIITNFFPLFVAFYNLRLHYAKAKPKQS